MAVKKYENQVFPIELVPQLLAPLLPLRPLRKLNLLDTLLPASLIQSGTFTLPPPLHWSLPSMAAAIPFKIPNVELPSARNSAILATDQRMNLR